VALTLRDWEGLLQQYRVLSRERLAAQKSGDRDLASRLWSQKESLARRYYNALPVVVMGVCPYDGIPVERKFDPFGFDGHWWVNPVPADDKPSCVHFVAVRGAVDFQGKKPPPRPDKRETYIGPGAPFVIPRLLKLDGVVAVIGELGMEPGYKAYTITYFGDPLPAPEEGVPNWCEDQLVYVKANGQQEWKSDEDAWDFNLFSWLKSGKLRWCVPGSNNSVLSSEPPGRCPYIGLPGTHKAQYVDEDGAWSAGPPDGTPGQPIDN
jgi:hypothetical protein